MLADEESALYDEGMQNWQNSWEQHDVSTALKFPTTKSVICKSFEDCGGNCMPGVHAVGAIEDNGRTTQTIYLKGAGYGLIGLVTTNAEKNALRRHVGDNWLKLPYMTTTALYEHEDEDDALTIKYRGELLKKGEITRIF